MIWKADDPAYWQTCARWALLYKYGYLDNDSSLNPSRVYRANNGESLCVPDGTSSDESPPPQQKEIRLVLSRDQQALINQKWDDMTDNLASHDNDLAEFLRSPKLLSNHRKLKWAVMRCLPSTQFKLHSHPNIELVYCVRGPFHEIRMDGEPVSKSFEAKEGDDSIDKARPKKLWGPDLSNLDRSWTFKSLRAGEWLVNEVGSIHKSFTPSKGNGCVLVVLWGGSHADVRPDQFPRSVDVDEAVKSVDKQLEACSCADWQRIQETFLPNSERSHSSQGHSE
jgi:hypothetical protein